MGQLIFAAKGINGQIEIYDGKICIRRKGVMSFMTHGLKGDKDILVSSISSIQFKNAGIMTNGYIQFAFMGGAEAKRGLFQATQDENSVMFDRKQQSNFEEVKRLVEEMSQRGQPSPQPSATTDPGDQIEKLAALRAKGLLSEDEFTAAKKKILGI